MGEELDPVNNKIVKEYLEQRNDFFDSDQDEETLYNSLLQYLWYIKLKNTCPITGAQLSKGFVADMFNILCYKNIISKNSKCKQKLN